MGSLQKEYRVQIAKEMLSADESILKRIITGAETWIYTYNTETSQQSSKYRLKGEAKPKNPRQTCSKAKAMLTVFFDWHGIVHQEFLPADQCVDEAYYLKLMRRLQKLHYITKRPELWQNKSWLLHHDNISANTSFIVSQFMTENSIATVPQPPNSPDLVPCDFFLFTRLKLALREHRLDSIEEMKKTMLRELKTIPANDYERCFNDWKRRWHICVAVGGDYFEDKLNSLNN